MSENSKLPEPSWVLRFLDRVSIVDLRLRSRGLTREIAIILAFAFFTALMTWPWVLHLRDAVADRGDPYMIAWALWWDFHQTFHNPLHLFAGNVFYPYQYSLAFSENDYGISLLFFPLFLAGLKPLTIHSIATFLGFAFSGYGAFRLTRTLSGRNGPAWIAGIVFAFVPFRFHVLSHLHYLFAGWIPLMVESLILYARKSSWRRASWMGIAFFMNALSCISWLILTIIPLALTVMFLVLAYKSLRRDREFWLRAAVAIGVASLALLPFIWPYFRVRSLYGLSWQPWEFAFNSPNLVHWLKAETRNKVWQNFGANIPGGHKLFPGMLAPLLALAAVRLKNQIRSRQIEERLLMLIDFVIVAAAIAAALAFGYGDTTYKLFGLRLVRLNDRSVNQALVIIAIALVLRIGIALPSLIHRLSYSNLIGKKIRPPGAYGAAVSVGAIWALAGFWSSLGANFFVNRWLHDYLFLFQSIRLPSRAAMICYLGLAVLAGIGAARIASHVQRYFSSRKVEAVVLVLIASAVLFELHASPLRFEAGEVDASALAVRLSRTSMRGGLVELPSTELDVSRHYYMLRAADHERPLVNATSSFISPLTDQINKATAGKIAPNFMDLLEKIPTSYLVIHNDRLLPGWQAQYEIFLTAALMSGRLRFINRFDGHDDLYAVVRNEPATKTEAALPFPLAVNEWSALIEKDQTNILAPASRAQTLYRMFLATTGALPRYAEFMQDAKTIARGVVLGSENEDQVFEHSLRQFAESWMARESFAQPFRELDDAQFVDRLLANAGIRIDPQERAALVEELSTKSQTRAETLLKIAGDRRFIEKENERSLVLLHFFAYLHRNPGDPPDRDLSGFNFWLRELDRYHDLSRLSLAFQNSIEYQPFKRQRQ